VLLYVVRRLAWAVLMVAVVSLITFVIFLGVPDNTINSRQGLVTPNLQAQWHLDGHSMPAKYVLFLKHVFLHADFGQSMRQPLKVREMLTSALPVTATLVVGGTIVFLLLAFPIGLLSALRPRSLLDKGLMAILLVGVSAHPVFLGLILSYFLGFKWHLFPIAGYCNLHYHGPATDICGGPRFWAYHMVLPWITFAFLFAALYARMIRANVLEALGEDYVRTARAKGASTWRILRRHVARNALLPVVSMLGMDVGLAFGGAIFIETVFDLPGVGQALYRALGSADEPVILGVALLVSVAVVIANLIVDLLYCFIDPRIGLRTGRHESTEVRLSRRRRSGKRTLTEPVGG
jgi:peptide/nickel transport system permease protein